MAILTLFCGVFSVFFDLFVKVLPLYIILLLGFVAGRWLKVDRESVAALMIYLVTPIVFFGGVSAMELSPVLLAVPLLGYIIAAMIGLSTFHIARQLYSDNRPSIMAVAAGTGNNGYFGLPVAMALFDAQTVGIYLMLVVGISLYESSIGFYVAAKGQHSARESLIKTLKLPPLYALALGCVMSMSSTPLPGFFHDLHHYFQGTYSVLGMMMIGLGLSSMRRFEVDLGFTAILFAARFVVWPLIVFALVTLDQQSLHWYGVEVHRALMLISFMPLAANSVAIASLLRSHPERVATAVLLSALFAGVYIPLMVGWLLP